MGKLFEPEVGRSIQKYLTPNYSYKAPDVIMAGLPKVDYFVCFKGKFIGIEAKEVKGWTCPPSDFSPGQKLALREIFEGGGLAVILVNFYRKPLAHDPGKTEMWIYGSSIRPAWTQLGESLRSEEGVRLEYQTGKLWDLTALASLV